MKAKKTWIVFDLDDTLIPSSIIYQRCYLRLRLGPGIHISRRQVKARLPKGSVSAHHRLLYFKNFLETQNQFSAREVLKLMARYEKLLAQEIQSWLKKSSVLKDLRGLKKNHHLALFTNETLRTQMIKIQKLDPDGALFDRILTSEEIGQEKKASGSYKKLLQFLKAKPSDCIMVGDDLAQDIRPSKKAGFKQSLLIQKAGDLKPLLLKIRP